MATLDPKTLASLQGQVQATIAAYADHETKRLAAIAADKAFESADDVLTQANQSLVSAVTSACGAPLQFCSGGYVFTYSAGTERYDVTLSPPDLSAVPAPAVAEVAP